MAGIKVLVLVILAICFFTPKSTEGSNVDFVKSNNEFALNFYNQLRKSDNAEYKNLIFSPFSIQIAGGLLYSGANGDTASEILNGFSLPGTDAVSVSDAFSKYLQTKNKLLKSNNLSMANKIYVMSGYSLKPTFMDIAVKNYNSDIENINFAEAQSAAENINKWVENNTGGKITELIQAEQLNSLTRMYLINAIHFKDEWKIKFDPAYTRDGDFYITPDYKVTIPMMFRNGKLQTKIYRDISVVAIDLGFKNSDLSLFIMMTEYINQDLSYVEDYLDSETITDIFNNVSEEESVQLTMPKFKIETEVNLKEILEKLNVSTMFGDADFSNLLDSPEPLSVSDGTHKAALEINEEGGEASAASDFGIQSRMGPVVLNVNRPFLYFIKSRSNEIYFMGRFNGN